MEKFKKKEIGQLIRCVKTLKLEVPLNPFDDEWRNIDNFLKKPGKNFNSSIGKNLVMILFISAGASVLKFHDLLKTYLKESTNPFSTWIYLNSMRSIVPEEQSQSEEQSFATAPDHSIDPSACADLSVFNMSSVSQSFPPIQQDTDLTFLLQLLPEIKSFDEKTKSVFKLQTLILIHNIKHNDRFKM